MEQLQVNLIFKHSYVNLNIINFREKSEFLEQELDRFSVYVSVLENLIAKHQNNQILSSPLKIIVN